MKLSGKANPHPASGIRQAEFLFWSQDRATLFRVSSNTYNSDIKLRGGGFLSMPCCQVTHQFLKLHDFETEWWGIWGSISPCVLLAQSAVRKTHHHCSHARFGKDRTYCPTAFSHVLFAPICVSLCCRKVHYTLCHQSVSAGKALLVHALEPSEASHVFQIQQWQNLSIN